MPTRLPHHISRRAALGVLGAGSAAVVVGCAPAVKPADLGQGSSSSASSSSSSASSSSSSSSASTLPGNSKNTGDVKLEKYDTSAGEHQPATRTEKPKNVPKPLLSDKANEKTIDGLYENIAYIAASMQYLFQTGDMEPFEKCALVSSEKSSLSSNTNASEMLKMIKEGNAWLDNPTVVFSLNTSTPSSSGSSYSWGGTMKMNMGSFVVVNSMSKDVESSKQHVDTDITFEALYSGSSWTIRSSGGAAGSGGFSI